MSPKRLRPKRLGAHGEAERAAEKRGKAERGESTADARRSTLMHGERHGGQHMRPRPAMCPRLKSRSFVTRQTWVEISAGLLLTNVPWSDYQTILSLCVVI